MLFKKFLLIILIMPITVALAENCSIKINSNDLMRYDKKIIEISLACKEFEVILHNNGRMPKTIMGHNLLITKSSDFRGVAADGVRATLKNDHIKPGDDRILAHTKMLGPGETDSFKLQVNKLDPKEKYVFFCSFPAHASSMKGVLNFKP